MKDQIQQTAREHLRESPLLLTGDATELLDTLREGARESGILLAGPAGTGDLSRPASVVVLAILSDGRRSSIAKAYSLLRDAEPRIAADAVQIVVIQSGRAKLAPDRLQRLLAAEILYQVATAMPHLVRARRRRSFREWSGLITLDAAGLQIVRFGPGRG